VFSIFAGMLSSSMLIPDGDPYVPGDTN
jgi:hypothetical protein